MKSVGHVVAAFLLVWTCRADSSFFKGLQARLPGLRPDAAPSSAEKPGEKSFGGLSEETRGRLRFFAACARAAYPGEPIPQGLRPFTRGEWEDCVLGHSYEGCSYSDDGFLNVGTGLRARLMARTSGEGAVVAWSGCDLGLNTAGAGARDVLAVVKQMAGSLDGQYEQARHVFKGILLGQRGRVDVVGHSLGGGLAAYVVATAEDHEDRVFGYTFNALGVSNSAIAHNMTRFGQSRAEERVVNVKGSRELLFRLEKAMASRHFGPVYDVPMGALTNWHGINCLIEHMEKAGAVEAP